MGALLVDCRLIEDMTLKPEHFFDRFHGDLFGLILGSHNKGRRIDRITIKSEAERLIASSGGDFNAAKYIDELAENVLIVSNAVDFAKDIQDLHKRRKLKFLGEDIQKKSLASNDSTASLVEELQTQLTGLEDENGEASYFTMQETLKSTLEDAQEARRVRLGGLWLSTGLNALDGLIGGLNRSDLLIIAGRPAMGKTSVATNIACSCVKTDKKVLFVSLEMTKEQLVNRILSEQTGISSNSIRSGDLSPEQFTDLVMASNRIEDWPLFIDDKASVFIEQLAIKAKKLKRNHGLDLIVVDYLQILKSKGENRTQEVSIISKELKILAKELNVPIIALSQLSRAVETRDDKRPNLSDLRESGSIEQDADIVMFVFREEYYLSKSEPEKKAEETMERYQERYEQWQRKLNSSIGRAEIIVGKHRHGGTGVVTLKFDAKTTTFSDIGSVL